MVRRRVLSGVDSSEAAPSCALCTGWIPAAARITRRTASARDLDQFLQPDLGYPPSIREAHTRRVCGSPQRRVVDEVPSPHFRAAWPIAITTRQRAATERSAAVAADLISGRSRHPAVAVRQGTARPSIRRRRFRPRDDLPRRGRRDGRREGSRRRRRRSAPRPPAPGVVIVPVIALNLVVVTAPAPSPHRPHPSPPNGQRHPYSATGRQPISSIAPARSGAIVASRGLEQALDPGNAYPPVAIQPVCGRRARLGDDRPSS